jgi:hypothetical protein
MGKKSGDKGRFNKNRRKKLAKRVKMRAYFGKGPERGTNDTASEAEKVRAKSP